MNWRLVRHRSSGEPDIEVRDPDDRSFGFSLLRELSCHPDSGMVEIAPGVYRTGNENSKPEAP